MSGKGKNAIDMTGGSLWKNILVFSLPLMMTQMLEVLFNLSDVAIAGKYADYIALGAVGSTALLVSLFTGILIGMGAGVNVRTAHQLGAEKTSGSSETVARTVYSGLIVCLIIGIILCLVCNIFARPMLETLKTKDELIESAVLYLKIYALGMPAMAVYNFGNGVLSACGETKKPLVYLSIAGMLNVILNIFFVVVCKKAADGVAIASVIAQYLSASMIMCHLLRRKDSCKLRAILRRRMQIHLSSTLWRRSTPPAQALSAEITARERMTAYSKAILSACSIPLRQAGFSAERCFYSAESFCHCSPTSLPLRRQVWKD